MNIAGVVFNLLGIGDSAYSVYDQLNEATNGYAIVRDLALGTANRQKTIFCGGAKVFWFELAKTLAANQATLQVAFAQEDLQVPQHLMMLTQTAYTKLSETDWFAEAIDSPATRSEWVCHDQGTKSQACLLPSDSGALQKDDGYEHPSAARCMTPSGFFRICAGSSGTTLVPSHCFGQEFVKRRWTLRLGAAFGGPHDTQLNIDKCLKPLEALATAHENLLDVQEKLPSFCR
eukprot:TRINITY_DN21945_c0_g1_i1.p1 TRINITY_DN21945_c0_g1~~TRINITY_DN21945_c0_g1_i1.p1  ORF type:complete len:232 (+),score=29.97 TRINITY_DN21945_c0_g1_i1:187-882(+)